LNEQISFIVKIQNIDTELSKFDELLKKSLNEIDSLQDNVKSKELELESLKGESAEINKKIGGFELDIKTFDDKLIKMKDTQKLIKTNKEYNAIQKSMKDSEALKKKSEEELLVHLENRDSINGKISSVQKEIKELEDALSAKNDEYKAKELEFGTVKKDFLDNREITKNKIKKDYLDIYESIKTKRGFPAIAPVMQSGACTGCYRMLPPQQFNELISENVFMQCPICSRILYIEAVVPEPAQQVPAAKAPKKPAKCSNAK
jgi:hypothetical protein